MKKIILLFIFALLINKIEAQQVGDTIVVKGFKYGSTTRDTILSFPNSNLTFEKIILRYNMRCKNNLVSTQAAPNQGCGEWDYSCNTFIIDSSKIENALNTTPNYVISNFSGNTFSYTSQFLYDYYNFSQTNVVLNSILSENQYTVGTGNTPAPNVLKSNEKSGKSQILYTAAELLAAGFTAGNINGIILNVANAGGIVNFFKVNMQQTSNSALNSNSLVLNGFTNVYNSNFNFASGNNRIQFHSPFIWNGTSNILIEFSFTNTNPSSQIIFNGVTSPSINAIYANNNYAIDLSLLGHVNLNANALSSISNELTVSFWVYGNSSMMPTQTSIVYGYGASSTQRNLNVHLPWSDGSIYYDCGYSNGGYDRINSVATATQQGGQWNHWTFTKNSTTGDMKIYLNGNIWTSGTAKTKPISILTLILGKDNNLLNNYKGKLNEFTIWNKELSQSDINAWMNVPINATHPFYSNLIAYYKMAEGNGLNINETKNNLQSTGINLKWTYDRGSNLTRMFNETNIKPNIRFLRGSYSSTTNTVIVKDSVLRFPNVVQQYSISSNASITPITDDIINLVATTNLYQATPLNIYNGDTGLLTGTISVPSTGVINIINLNYYKRYPFYNEIMSFVTPYGKGLNLGATGKTWFFDVSDFAPILKGNKKISIALGGQNQEQMDLDFWFIVGTPPKPVLSFNQLWQGAARAGGAGIASINNDSRFELLNVPILNTAQSFKLRSTITGHGSQGEFQQNGGQINHFFNVNGGTNEYTWQISQKCSTNPIFPQGGTWLYDRQGWCPGNYSLLKELDLTPYITPGNTVTLDYGCSNPPNPNGDYRYIVANQLISYGPASHSLDARILGVLAPSDKVEYSRSNPICSSPKILVQNSGSTTLTNLEIEYWINNNINAKETYTWTGNLLFMDTTTILLPIANLWQSGVLLNNNVFNATIKKVNTITDQYNYNNNYRSKFNVPITINNSFIIEFKTGANFNENSYSIIDDQGNTVGLSNFTAANTIYNDNYTLFNGCYTLRVLDYVGDGLSWWANTAQGNGYVKLRNSLGNLIKSFEPDFGSSIEYNFTVSSGSNVSFDKNNFNSNWRIHPNPSHGKFTIEINDLELTELKITDIIGHNIEIPYEKNKNSMEFNTRLVTPGVYLVSIKNGTNWSVKKIIIQ